MTWLEVLQKWRTWVFHLFWFESFIQVVSDKSRFNLGVTNLRWGFFGLALKFVRLLCKCTNPFDPALLVKPNLQLNQCGPIETYCLWTLISAGTVIRLSPKAIWWMASNCSSVIKDLGQPDRGPSSGLLLLWFNF